jgi:hypothetical protein
MLSFENGTVMADTVSVVDTFEDKGVEKESRGTLAKQSSNSSKSSRVGSDPPRNTFIWYPRGPSVESSSVESRSTRVSEMSAGIIAAVPSDGAGEEVERRLRTVACTLLGGSGLRRHLVED